MACRNTISLFSVSLFVFRFSFLVQASVATVVTSTFYHDPGCLHPVFAALESPRCLPHWHESYRWQPPSSTQPWRNAFWAVVNVYRSYTGYVPHKLVLISDLGLLVETPITLFLPSLVQLSGSSILASMLSRAHWIIDFPHLDSPRV